MVKVVTGSQFASSYCLRPEQFSWFLGAGASASAGIPTGYSMILDFKKRLFCQLSSISLRDVDSNDPLWQQRMDLFFSSRSELPPPNDPTEYAKAFEAVYPTQEERRIYIENAVKKGTISFPHRVLAAMLTNRRIPCIFTTNFDHLVEDATTLTDQMVDPGERANLTTAAIDNAARAELCLRESRWPLLAKLHGDFQSLELKNTADELMEQDARMRQVLRSACARFGLVVVGYSGRDESVMSALNDALETTNAFPGGIYWVTRSGDSILPSVRRFLERATQSGVDAALVESPTFDELAGDIVDNISLPQTLREYVQLSRPVPFLIELPLPEREHRDFPVLQCSALPILSMPQKARRIEVDNVITTTRARELVRDVRVKAVVASIGREVVAFGADSELLKAFESVGGRLAGHIELHPENESWAKGLIYDALVLALSAHRPVRPKLRRRGHALTVSRGFPDDSAERIGRRNKQLSRLKQAYGGTLTGTVDGHEYPFSEGIQIRIDQVAGRWWCVFEPYTDVRITNEGVDGDGSTEKSSVFMSPSSPVMDWQRERWAMRRNREWARIVAAWAEFLASDSQGVIRAIGFNDEVVPGLDAEFQLSPITGWSRPGHEHAYFQRDAR